MPRIEAAIDTEPYDEFGMLHENAEEIGLAWDRCRRQSARR